MFSYLFSFAGFTVGINSDEKININAQFAPFLSNNEPDVLITVQSGKLPKKEGQLLMRSRRHECYERSGELLYFSSYQSSAGNEMIFYSCQISRGGEHTLILDYDGRWDTMVFDSIDFPRIFAENNAVLLHSSFIDIGGEAIVFTAPKQTGKSTQAALWQKLRNAKIINGDRTALRFEGGLLLGCGTPWRGTSGISEKAELPVKAIVSLSQAPVNAASALNSSAAFIKLWEGVCNEFALKTNASATADLVAKICFAAPIVSLKCMPDEGAIIELERFLKL